VVKQTPKKQAFYSLAHEAPKPILLFGLPVDSSGVFVGKIKRNQTLSAILQNFGVSDAKIYAIAQTSKNIYDLRKLNVGKKYSIVHKMDSNKTVDYFIFEPDLKSFVVFSLGDSVYTRVHHKKIDLVERSIAASIHSSLYETAIDIGAPPLLVSKLVDVLAWQVDFFRIQEGDKFKVIYEEESIEGKPIGIKQITGVYFEHFDKIFYGIRYSIDQKEDYFDQDGNSLRKTFLRAPLNYKRISSRYSGRRYHPVQKRYKAHLGTDYAAATGTPIHSVGEGIVVEAKYKRNNGNYVKIKHNSTYSTQYLHMQKIKRGIRPGVQVEQGQTIGFVGSTGLATGPHLCFRFWKNNKQVDALKVDLPPSDPINPKALNDFLHEKNRVMKKLEQLSFNAPYT
jgi:murein DD-endopeptidase MepM/ murein hydrolase activator NlpD